MEIVKKNLISIICGGVALLAILLLWLLVGNCFDRLGQQMDKSVSAYTKLRSLDKKTFDMPVVDLKKKAPVKLLNKDGQYGFPTAATFRTARNLVEQMRVQSLDMMKLAVDMNIHQPLEPMSLPVPTQNGPAEFKTKYYRKMDEIRELMGAVPPPTHADIEARKVEMWDAFKAKELITDAAGRNNEAELKKRFDEKMAPTVPGTLRDERSRKRMYINEATRTASGGPQIMGPARGALDYHNGIPSQDSPQLPNVGDIWVAQLGLWIQEDVARALARANEKCSPGTRNAVVKRLVSITVPRVYITKAGSVTITGLTGGSVASPGGDASSKGLAQSPTGRTCNNLYDVMHFSVKIDVDARYLSTVLTSLSYGQFITVLKCDALAVDRHTAFDRGMIYGDAPVVQADLQCEAIFFREWTVGSKDHRGLMPDVIKRVLNIQPAGRTMAMAK